jgi:hypothetical protein
VEARRVWDAEVGGSSPPTPTICLSPERWEASLHGLKVNKESRKLDVVLVAARYSHTGVLEFAKGYERRGYVWSDVRVFDRETLLQKVKSGARIVTGDPVKIPGNFDLNQVVRVEGQAGDECLIADGSGSGKDDLGLPVL